MNKGDLVWCPAQTLLIPSNCKINLEDRGPIKLILQTAMKESFYTKSPKVVYVLGREAKNLIKIIHSGRAWYVEEKNLYQLNGG